ncbi:DUF2986 domain-containing protein [Parashewanella curva]|uniref:DUF2986 domain-containing protein n=1 Tax=Parashewanella curva TaxID=2338552 RepID=A0A3L8Q0P6_9GAMM|nr:DUF2986 domain-containing protein [Parashewanella curva]RLV61020.1 DUF2986 domain-containing protein [Parashewanella curva]
MNKRQKINKKIAKRAKAKLNKVKCGGDNNTKKPRYISKAERAKLEAEQQAEISVASDGNPIEQEA